MTIPAPAKPLTDRQEAAVRAYLVTGDVKHGARWLGIPEATMRSRLHNARRRTGLPTLGHLLYWIDRQPRSK